MSLMQDGRKSFRAISREIKVSTPTIKSRYERLINMGLIKGVRPEIDLSKVDTSRRAKVLGDFSTHHLQGHRKDSRVNVDNLKLKMQCEYCGGPINGRPKVLEFANFQRFFCCMGCKTHYHEKHAGRIESIIEQYNEMRKGVKK